MLLNLANGKYQFRLRLRSKWIFLSAFWILSFLILIVVSTNNGLNAPYNKVLIDGSQFKLPKNQVGTFSCIRRDPKENYNPIYSASFENLLVENNNLGFFKTALHKVVKIRGLKLRFYGYTSAKTTATTNLDSNESPKGITTDAKALLVKAMRRLMTPVDGWRISNIDLGNVSEVRVNNFDYKVFYDDNLSFGIQSKRAIASYKHSGIILRGHAKLTLADGTTLESNSIKWDIKKQHFSANGVYVLNCGGIVTTGKDICVDAQLKSVKAQHVKSKQKEAQKCFAKL